VLSATATKRRIIALSQFVVWFTARTYRLVRLTERLANGPP
jgi:hypothetical protein